MGNNTEVKKKRGRPPLEEKRSSWLRMRTYPEIAEKAKRVGNEAVEKAIRAIKEPKQRLCETDREGMEEYEVAMDRERP